MARRYVAGVCQKILQLFVIRVFVERLKTSYPTDYIVKNIMICDLDQLLLVFRYDVHLNFALHTLVSA